VPATAVKEEKPMTDPHPREPDDGDFGDDVDKEMARADQTNGERPPGERDRSGSESAESAAPDKEAAGAYVDDKSTAEVAEPNEPA